LTAPAPAPVTVTATAAATGHQQRPATAHNAWLCFEDESGRGLRPPKGRTRGRRGHTPVVTVTGGHDTRVSLAALIPHERGRRGRSQR
jgi:hypothetical protein